MSSNVRKTPAKADRRSRRTRGRLGDALIELIQEKPFDDIRVQEVVERSGVGRSTFYAHFSNRDDLFASDVDDFCAAFATLLERRGEASDRLAPVEELFSHVASERRLYRALVGAGRMQDVLDLCRGHMARSIERRLAALPRARGLDGASRAAMAETLAGGLVSLLTWWLDRGAPGSAREMDELFHRLARSGAGAG